MCVLTELLLLLATTYKKYRKHHPAKKQQSHTLSLRADAMHQQTLRKTEQTVDMGKKVYS